MHSEPLPRRRRLRPWLLRLLAAALILVVTVVLARECYYAYFNFVDRDEIKETLPAGSSPEQIFNYLGAENIEHTPGKVYSASEWSVVGDLYGVPGTRGLIVAIVRNT